MGPSDEVTLGWNATPDEKGDPRLVPPDDPSARRRATEEELRLSVIKTKNGLLNVALLLSILSIPAVLAGVYAVVLKLIFG